ncbi:MAG: hypothetical protein KDE51_08270 [Anaerolineales bacterium]|nr:hypothetical protein [Anaerolineales bacterium]
MNPNNQSLQKLLVSHEVSLTELCLQLNLNAQQMAEHHEKDPYGRLLITLAEQERLPELYSYLENSYPQVQWREQVNGIFMNAQRDI